MGQQTVLTWFWLPFKTTALAFPLSVDTGKYIQSKGLELFEWTGPDQQLKRKYTFKGVLLLCWTDARTNSLVFESTTDIKFSNELPVPCEGENDYGTRVSLRIISQGAHKSELEQGRHIWLG